MQEMQHISPTIYHITQISLSASPRMPPECRKCIYIPPPKHRQPIHPKAFSPYPQTFPTNPQLPPTHPQTAPQSFSKQFQIFPKHPKSSPNTPNIPKTFPTHFQRIPKHSKTFPDVPKDSPTIQLIATKYSPNCSPNIPQHFQTDGNPREPTGTKVNQVGIYDYFIEMYQSKCL